MSWIIERNGIVDALESSKLKEIICVILPIRC